MSHQDVQQLHQLPVAPLVLVLLILHSSCSIALLALAIDVEGTTPDNVLLGFGNASFLLK